MNNSDIKIALEWLGAIVVSVGGTSIIVIGLAKWFGERLANNPLEKDKAKYQEELEGLKTKYQTEIEIKKMPLKNQRLFF